MESVVSNMEVVKSHLPKLGVGIFLIAFGSLLALVVSGCAKWHSENITINSTGTETEISKSDKSATKAVVKHESESSDAETMVEQSTTGEVVTIGATPADMGYAHRALRIPAKDVRLRFKAGQMTPSLKARELRHIEHTAPVVVVLDGGQRVVTVYKNQHGFTLPSGATEYRATSDDEFMLVLVPEGSE